MTILFAVAGYSREARQTATAYPVQYQGGSLPLRQYHAVNAMVAGNAVVFVQRGQRFVVAVENINEISCATDVHRRFGAPVLRLVPRLDLDQVENDYVSVRWTDQSRNADRTVLFKLSHAEYRDFVAALERLTGKKAVNTKKTPTTVHYDL